MVRPIEPAPGLAQACIARIDGMGRIPCISELLSNEAPWSVGSYLYPNICGVGGAHGAIPRARSELRSGDLGCGRVWYRIELISVEFS